MNGGAIFSHSVLMDGNAVMLSKYAGCVTVLVNTASLCSFTSSNIQHLIHVQQKWASRSFTVLAFPCSQFGNQEPKKRDEICCWVARNGINFPVFDKVNLKGPNTHPLFQMIQSSLGPIRWNYTKVVCNRAGLPCVKLQPGSSLEELERYVSQLCDE
ncbi:glutathione peroxidase, putative [Trypanosoma equiperdum]|uniref:Glutathione peroxidase n=4 Tax=Trypanozoon TaxID=39700 RepID=Q381J4_TRYB2|nr:glutathione peroxidase, putative [Trypanosoma brucei gambiense DAL972]XP_829649.1 glutathione peroxidase, putative [Trypanosoma brucei brucei TREU927]RHW67879.1 glutathione peroxidase [Trypanosoma brucei equiperdum]SCU67018.1 glutathione peroxidase, putative [Trypanosoma equiperdum]EAN80537.1 glutathione peroxidase, putative [Trypanosoma brucei brucei TREU927]CBH18665.1 glutathione peroxidase, putative [Trypanosoma brucei gambiense DAL972]|eukprot:XP_011780929.1 glutathione peroxidase, putative [Trypanosoma brucei gambiense DAL972]